MSRRALALIALSLLLVGGAVTGRRLIARLVPIHHQGTVLRIAPFHKGGFSAQDQETRQVNQFAIIFSDGFQCEGTDTSFAAVREGDKIELRGYHDVRGWPLLNPEWWECDEAQLVRLIL